MTQPLVTPTWLKQQLDANKDIIILDASIEFQIPLEPEKDKDGVIPKAQRFDYDTVFCDPDSSLPHMMPTEARFNTLASTLGITQESTIVVYDNSGTYASPRAWWMLKAMGISNVYVLSGGLPAWKAAGYECIDHYTSHVPSSASLLLDPHFFLSAEQVLSHSVKHNAHIVDARSLARFKGEVKEPRQGVRSGHIPHSVCLPFAELIDSGTMKPFEDLAPLFSAISASKREHLVFSCGSGVTACILALGAYICGYHNLSVYDGSWTEWGQRVDLPIEK
ncbi:3-mercaptopyruvate sulfurtransferase [Vibrio thalassae]|uniref:3-mercaptopyruvate sulfurtransferase n=1 Tax=Vibrio thalassae TaxID=1243014 RepID=A0A240EI74_9VIBR|nr:sulfurtransferase [Vibrio thalassae]SNX48397.1 3-mercaptopyruvate sulfurtransferase [Vibrio thalassae]